MWMLKQFACLSHDRANYAQPNTGCSETCDEAQFHEVCEADRSLSAHPPQLVHDNWVLLSGMTVDPDADVCLGGVDQLCDLGDRVNARFEQVRRCHALSSQRAASAVSMTSGRQC